MNKAQHSKPTERIKIDSTKPVRMKITSEPYVMHTWMGYAAVVDVLVLPNKERQFFLFIGPKTLATPIEKLREANGGQFIGIQFSVRRDYDAQRAPYIVQPITTKIVDTADAVKRPKRRRS